MRRISFTAILVSLGVAGCADSIHNLVARGELDELRTRLEMNPQACGERNREGKTALHYAINAAQREAFIILVESGGCDINAADQTGLTPLHSAAFIGLPQAVPMLLEAGAKIDARDSFGDTPLHTAAMKGRVEMVRALIDAGADIGVVNKAGMTPAQLAEFHRQPEAAAAVSQSVR
jgi:ankyrin repeat protein